MKINRNKFYIENEFEFNLVGSKDSLDCYGGGGGKGGGGKGVGGALLGAAVGAATGGIGSAAMAIGAGVGASVGSSVGSAAAQAKATKQAANEQIQAQKQASEQAKKMRQQQDINNAMSETAKTTYGAGADTKRIASASTDLLIPSTIEQNLGGTKNRTGLGF